LATEDVRREQAIKNLKRKRKLVSHVVSFLVVNIVIVVIWYATGRGYFWPGWVMLATGIALVMDVWNTYRRSSGEMSEDDIRREMDKLAAN
jgi:hypothetical protein